MDTLPGAQCPAETSRLRGHPVGCIRQDWRARQSNKHACYPQPLLCYEGVGCSVAAAAGESPSEAAASILTSSYSTLDRFTSICSQSRAYSGRHAGKLSMHSVHVSTA